MEAHWQLDALVRAMFSIRKQKREKKKTVDEVMAEKTESAWLIHPVGGTSRQLALISCCELLFNVPSYSDPVSNIKIISAVPSHYKIIIIGWKPLIQNTKTGNYFVVSAMTQY